MKVPTQTKQHQWSRMVVTPIEVLSDDDGNNTGMILETDDEVEVIGCFQCDAAIEDGWGTPCLDAGTEK